MNTTAPTALDGEFSRALARFTDAGAGRAGWSARAPVSVACIRQMTDAVGDRNPVYTDETLAKSSVHGGLVAPPLWIYSWMMRGLEPEPETARTRDGVAYFHLAPAGQQRARPQTRTLRDELNELLESRGYASPAVTNMNYTFRRYLRPGETPRFSSWIIDRIAGPKETKIGSGFFVDLHVDVFVGDEPVATIGQRYLRSKPHGPASAGVASLVPAPLPPADPLPALEYAPFVPRLVTRRIDEVRVGDALPELQVRLSPTLIIAGALASQDFQDVHHDYLIMGQRGHPGIFMNMMTTSGLLGRYLTDWTGPEALIRAHDVRLGRPNYPGDTLSIRGTVRSVEPGVQGGRVVVDLKAENRLGIHAEGSIDFELR